MLHLVKDIVDEKTPTIEDGFHEVAAGKCSHRNVGAYLTCFVRVLKNADKGKFFVEGISVFATGGQKNMLRSDSTYVDDPNVVAKTVREIARTCQVPDDIVSDCIEQFEVSRDIPF